LLETMDILSIETHFLVLLTIFPCA